MESRFDTELNQFLSSYNVAQTAEPIFEQTVGLLAGISTPLNDGSHGIENREFYMNMCGLDEEDAEIILAYLQELCDEAGVVFVPGDVESQELGFYEFRISESSAYHQLLPAFKEIFVLLANEAPDFLTSLRDENYILNVKPLDEMAEYLANHFQFSEIACEVIVVINDLLSELALLIKEDRDKMIQMQDNFKQIANYYKELMNGNEVLQNDEDVQESDEEFENFEQSPPSSPTGRILDGLLPSLSLFSARPMQISVNINVNNNLSDNKLNTPDENNSDDDSEMENVIEYESLSSSSETEELSDCEIYYESESSQTATPTNSPRP